VNDWVFRPDLREQIVRVIEVTASPLHAALLVARCAMASNVLCFTLGTLAPLATVRWLILHGKL
jgi:hypothetical protein